jgi:Lrp/AsnC family transcriptional regulator of ectoine degradation
MAPASALRLDAIDLRIVSVLARDGRITKLDLAEAVGLSASACLERMKRLERAGVIRGYRAEIDLARIGPVTTAFVEIELKRHEAADFDRFERAIAMVPEVMEVHAIGGGIDYLVRVVARGIDDYQALIDRLLAEDIGIGRYFTYFVTKPVFHRPDPPLGRLIGGA